MIALSSGFTVIRVLFRFLIERILLRVLNDRVFFESSEVGFSSLGYAVIDSSLHQCSFSALFIKSRYYTFYQKQIFCYPFIMILKNNQLSMLTSAKVMKKYIIETQSIILKIYVINFPIYLYNQLPGEFQVQKQPPVVFFK